MSEGMMKPDWLECRELSTTIEDILTKLDRQPANLRARDITVDLSKKSFKTLREPPEHGDDEWLWHQIELAIEAGVFVLDHGKKAMLESHPTEGKLRFQFDMEDQLRQWLNHPKPDLGEDWHQALEQADDNSINTEFLRTSKLEIHGMSAQDVMTALENAKMDLLNNGPKTLRNIAAAFFSGASKALDNKGEKWLSIAMRISPDYILPRKIHLNAFTMNPDSRTVLFIENLDTFEACCSSNDFTNKFILVYLSGYKGVSQRIRNHMGVRIFISGNCDQKSIEDCIIGSKASNVYIWADLDYAGLDIAVSLKHQYPELEFFEDAYVAMIHIMNTKGGHAINHASKGDQKSIEPERLWGIGQLCLERINTTESFVDQESVSLDSIKL